MQAAVWVLIGINVLFLVVSRLRRSSAATEGGLSVEAAQVAVTRDKTERFAFVTRMLRGGKTSSKIERNLVSAGLLIKPSEFYMINLVVLGLTVLLGLVFLNRMPNEGTFFSLVRRTGLVVVSVWLGYNIPRWTLQFLANQRRTKLDFQLADALAIISSALRGGFSFVQGLDMASQQLEPPTESWMLVALTVMS